MAYGQIDPARLEGDALTRWYLRSPTDIEQERQGAAAQSYDDFFGRTDEAPDQRDGASINPSPAQGGLGNWGAGASPSYAVYRPDHDSANWTEVAANSPTCANCHSLLPPLAPIPIPFGPLLRRIPSFPQSGRPEDDRKQCEIQDRNDRQICGRQPSEQDRAICHASASVRWKNCLRTGHVDDPALDTAKRLRGR
jgi:hypothetical protein